MKTPIIREKKHKPHITLKVVGVVLLLAIFRLPGFAQQWTPQAPGPNTKGQVEEIDDGEVVGAIKTVAAHPTNPNIVYVGAVNGGLWRTNNGMAPSPSWEHLADNQQSLSIGALEFDPNDSTSRTLIAGNGRFSSFGADGGSRSGLLRTIDGGVTWTSIDGRGVLKDLNISGLALRGPVIVISVNFADNPTKVGIWRSPDTGATWQQISGRQASGLPRGPSSDLSADPSNVNRLFTNAGDNGLFRSDNAGASWTKVSNPAMDALIAGTDNVKIDVGRNNNVYVAIVKFKSLAGVFRSGDGGNVWDVMDLPQNAEGGIHPGLQGGNHLSIAADRTNANIVYIGGDRQEPGASNFPAPNSIGARDYSGRLFRGDASKPAGSQWVHLTHSHTLGAAGGGTARGSAPHADSRDMAMAANGMLLEVDDGGIYRRTSPQDNTGDWLSMNGDMQATEFHSVAWDSISKIVIGGAQDTGTPAQRLSTNVKWASISTGDGGVVAVDDISSPDRSTRYSSFYELGGFRRQVYDSSNTFQSEVRPGLQVLNGAPIAPLFYSPIKLNAVVGSRLMIGAENGLFESTDQGDTLTLLSPTIMVNETGANIIAYGATGNPDVLYVGSGNDVFIRTVAGQSLVRSTGYHGRRVMSVAINPADAKTAYAIDSGSVFRTTNSGASWTDITGNLQTLKPGGLRSIAYSTSAAAGAILIGGNNGVFEARGPAFSRWSAMGTGLPKAPVYHIEYDPVDRIILVGTLGRGAWTLSTPPAPAPPSLASSHVVSQSTSGTKPAETVKLPTSIPAQQPSATANPGRTELGPGVVVDTLRDRVYVMAPDGKVHALKISTGAEVWTNSAAAKPLGLVGSRLLAQAESSNAESALRIVVLDPATGERMATALRELPGNVKPQLGETLRGELMVELQGAANDAVVSWQFSPRQKKGIRPDTPDALPGSPDPTSNPGNPSGVFRIDLNTGLTSSVSELSSTVAPLSRPVSEQVPGLPKTQTLSSDRRYLMVSTRVGDEREWQKYLLTIYDRTTGNLVGQFPSHLSTVPFVVTNSTVVFATGPYIQRSGNDYLNEPAKIRALDLTSGKELWSAPIRDTTYDGPYPP
jgi:photosystem II stability/assembly factor-like uncharacterized protein